MRFIKPDIAENVCNEYDQQIRKVEYTEVSVLVQLFLDKSWHLESCLALWFFDSWLRLPEKFVWQSFEGRAGHMKISVFERDFVGRWKPMCAIAKITVCFFISHFPSAG